LFRRQKLLKLFLIPLAGCLLASCTISSETALIIATKTHPWVSPTPTRQPVSHTPTIDTISSNNQLLAFLYSSGGDIEWFAHLDAIRADGKQHEELLVAKEMFIRDLAASPDGNQIAFWGCTGVMTSGCYAEGDIVVMDWEGSERIHLTDAQGDDRNPDWSPDGRIAFASDRSDSLQIYLMNPGWERPAYADGPSDSKYQSQMVTGWEMDRLRKPV
jgi:hypothetical protein